MKVLIVESTTGLSRPLQDQLNELGHSVVTCSDPETGGPCRSVRTPDGCPLSDPVDLTVVVRPDGGPDTLLEMGAVCAERHRVPVVRVDPEASDIGTDVARAAASGKDRIEAAYAAVVRAALELRRATIEVEQAPRKVIVKVGLPGVCTPMVRSTVADQVRAIVRAYDPFVASIDISVEVDSDAPSTLR